MKEPNRSANTKNDISSFVYGKVPPQARELEEAILGAMLLERNSLETVQRIIRHPDCFYVEGNQKIYSAIVRLCNKSAMVDLLTVSDELRKTDDLENAGGMQYLIQLTSSVVSSAHVETHSRIVMEKFFQREIIRFCGLAVTHAYDESRDVFETLELVQGNLGSIVDHIKSGSVKLLGASMMQAIQAMEQASLSEGDMLGLPTGLKKLDALTLGLTAPDQIIIAAGTGEGKTTLAVNIAENMALDGNPILFFSLEMRDRQLVWKILSRHIEEDIKTIRTGKFSADKWQQLKTSIVSKLSALPFHIYDQGGINIIELKAVARTMQKKHGIKAVFVDYIQLVKGAGRKFGTREEEVNYVSKELKSLAMELDIPIITLSQLNRMEKGAKRLYRLNDLRESGAIEQDADGVIFVYRPSEHDVPDMKIGNETLSFTETDALIDIAKWRLGENGTFRVRFDGRYNSFSDYVEPHPFPDLALQLEKPISEGIQTFHQRNNIGFSSPTIEAPYDPDLPF